jgi:hypothetical protein
MSHMRTLERTAVFITLVLLVVFAALVTFQVARPVVASPPAQLQSVSEGVRAPVLPAHSPAAPFPYPAHVFCPACAIDSLPIPIWRQSDAINLACWLGSGDSRDATVLAEERSVKGARMLQLRTARCTGWLPDTWVKRR